MTKDEVRAILITAFVTTPDMRDDMAQISARLIIPLKRKRMLFRRS